MNEVERLHSANAGLKLSHVRADLDRDTRILVTRNIDGHVHITLGRGREAILIIHPHAARRLAESINAVLSGKDFAYE